MSVKTEKKKKDKRRISNEGEKEENNETAIK